MEITMKLLIGYACYVICAIPIYRSITSLLQVKRKWWCKPILVFISWLLLGMIIFIGDWGNLPATLLIFMLGIWTCCEGSGWKRLVIGLMLASTVFAFNGFLDNALETVLFEYVGMPFNGITRLIYSLVKEVYVLFLYLLIRSRKPRADFELTKPLWKLLLVLNLPSFGIVLSLVLLRSPYGRNLPTILADSALFLIAAFAIIGLIWAMLVLERQQALEQENALSRMNKQYFESMEQQNFAIRRLKHDLGNHLQTLLALPEEKRTVYIEEMLGNTELTQTLHYSGDTTVNVVLSAKEMVMREKSIHFVPRLDIPGELPFAKADICALFANALDNAIEACEKLPIEERRIRIEGKLGKGLLAVSVRNSYVKTDIQQTQGKLPKTTKQDGQNHGFGLKSIQEIVKRYGGSMEIQKEEKEFVLFLYLPMGESISLRKEGVSG